MKRTRKSEIANLQHAIDVTVDDVKHCGYYEISGIRKLRFKVFFLDRQHSDSFDYRPDQLGYIREMARLLLWEMVKGMDLMLPPDQAWRSLLPRPPRRMRARRRR